VGGAFALEGANIHGGHGGDATANGGEAGPGSPVCGPDGPGGSGATGGDAAATGGAGADGSGSGSAGDGGDATATGGRGGRGGNGSPPGPRGDPGDSTASAGAAGTPGATGVAGIEGFASEGDLGAGRDGELCPVSCSPNAAAYGDGGYASVAVSPVGCPGCEAVPTFDGAGIPVRIEGDAAIAESSSVWTLVESGPTGTLDDDGDVTFPLDLPTLIRAESGDAAISLTVTASASDIRAATISGCARHPATPCSPLSVTLSADEASVTVDANPATCACTAFAADSGATVVLSDNDDGTATLTTLAPWEFVGGEDAIKLIPGNAPEPYATLSFMFHAIRHSVSDHEVTLQLQVDEGVMNAGVICLPSE